MINKLKAFLNLVRWVNLIYIALTQWLVCQCLNIPTLKIINQQPILTTQLLILLILSTVFIASAGYIINDYFDVKADELNKPNKIYIGRYFSRRTSMVWHALLNVIGILMGFGVAYKVGNFYLGFIHLLVWFGLWYYSVLLKKQLLTGNLLVSFLTALVVVIVGIFEPNISIVNVNVSYTNYYVYLYGFAFFAFLLNFQREVVKDMEDIKGDLLIGGQTLPISLGIPRAKHAASIAIAITIAILLMYQFWAISVYSENAYFIVFYCLLCLEIPLGYLLFLLKGADTPKKFKTISNWQKLIMLLGILLLPIIRYQLLN